MFFSAKTREDIDDLISQGVDINSQDSFFGQTYLHILVQTNSPLLDYFLEKGPNPNIVNKDGKTPIYYAKNVDTVEKLIKHGASILNIVNTRVISEYMTSYINKKMKPLRESA